jgi:hypothetical protein
MTSAHAASTARASTTPIGIRNGRRLTHAGLVMGAS